MTFIRSENRVFGLLLAVGVTVHFLYLAAVLQAAGMRKQLCVLVAVVLFLAPVAFSAITYQGARLRLWLEPFIVLAAAATFQQAFAIWARYRQTGTIGGLKGARMALGRGIER